MKKNHSQNSTRERNINEAPSSFAIIIGAMKSGTTTLFDLLQQHPEIACSKIKEPDFFSENSDPNQHWDEYLDLWDWDPDRHKIALEASTSYTKLPFIKGVPARIAASPAKKVKFIYLMRNPISRIASQVRHSLYEGWGKSLDEGITEDLIDFSKYAMQIDAYAEIFPRENILLLTMEELSRSPEEVLQKVCKFLDISSNFNFKNQEQVSNTGDLYNIHPIIAAFLKNRLVRRAGNMLLKGNIRRHVRNFLARLSSRTELDKRWQLNEKESSYVIDRLASDLDRLKFYYNVDFESLWHIRMGNITQKDSSRIQVGNKP